MTKPYILSRNQEALAEELVASGRYVSVGDVIHDALQLLRAHEPVTVATFEDLRRAWQDGVESGDYRSLDGEFDSLEIDDRAPDQGRHA